MDPLHEQLNHIMIILHQSDVQKCVIYFSHFPAKNVERHINQRQHYVGMYAHIRMGNCSNVTSKQTVNNFEVKHPINSSLHF